MKVRMMSRCAAMLAAAVVVAAPAVAQESNTVLVDDKGEVVDSLLLRYRFEGMWALDDQRILLRDTYRDHYLITLEEPCPKLDMDRSVLFVPALSGRIRAARTYEVRDKAGEPCLISKVEWIEDAQAAELRQEAVRG